VADERIGGLEDQFGVGDVQHLEHVLEDDLLAAVRDELVEGPDGVAKAACRGPRDRGKGAVVGFDLLRVGDFPQDRGYLVQRGTLEVEPVATVDDRREHLVRLGCCEHEDRVRRRLLERLQERIPRGGREHVRLVEYVDLPPADGRREADLLPQLADVVDRVVGGSIHLDHVERGRIGDGPAGLALAAWSHGRSIHAVERAREDLGNRGLARTARADEQVGVMNLALLDRIAERAHYVRLPDDLVEGLRPVTAVEASHGGRPP
jgi:hypothetical protein